MLCRGGVYLRFHSIMCFDELGTDFIETKFKFLQRAKERDLKSSKKFVRRKSFSHFKETHVQQRAKVDRIHLGSLENSTSARLNV